MRVSLNPVLSRPAVAAVPRVERNDIDELRYIAPEVDERGARKDRKPERRPPRKDEAARFISTPSEQLATTLVELQIAALPQDGSPLEAGAAAGYAAWLED